MKNVAVTFGIVCRKEKIDQQNEALLYIRLAYDSKRGLNMERESRVLVSTI